MRRRLFRKCLAVALALAGVSATSSAQRARSPVERVERATQAAARAQERAARAQDRVTRIPDQLNRGERAQRRLDRLPAAAERGQHIAGQASRGEGPPGVRGAALQRGEEMARAYPERLEMTRSGVSVRGQVIAVDPPAEQMSTLRRAGYRTLLERRIEGIDLRMVVLQVPRGRSVDQALLEIASLAPALSVSPNHLHFQSATLGQRPTQNLRLAGGRVSGEAVGLIDAGVARHPSITSPVEQRGFAEGGSVPNVHATAIASLLVGAGRPKGVVQHTALLAADVYGADPAGGSALTVAEALGWLIARGIKVIAMPVTGPRNVLLEVAVAAAQRRGAWIVAPVGNNGPAAPPTYPASYPGVIAVTAVDGRRRILIEAGRSPELHYAAPGADILAAEAGATLGPVRGTSFAVPFVAGRLMHVIRRGGQDPKMLDAEAVDLGRPGPDPIYGRGLICGGCGTSR